MTVLLNRSYGGFPSGAIVSLPASTEAALIAQNLAQASAAVPTAGAMTSNEYAGRVTFAAGASSLVVTNPNCTATSKIGARINQAAADGTMTGIRVVPGNGQFTIYANAAATAPTVVDWEMVSTGMTPNQ